MPTSLPTRPTARPKRPDLLVVFLVALAMAFVAIEIMDPAPMDVEAALITAP